MSKAPTPNEIFDSTKRKEVMLALVYPAVLGGIIYFLMDESYKHFFDQGEAEMTIPHFIKTLMETTPIQLIKMLLAFITVAFYICDYLYITFTRSFKGYFFIFDVLFLLLSFLTVKLISIGTHVQPHYKFIS